MVDEITPAPAGTWQQAGGDRMSMTQRRGSIVAAIRYPYCAPNIDRET